jgi:hypothetical protein
MDQKLAEQKPKRIQKVTTQTYKIQQIWKKIPKTEYNKEQNPDKKVLLKGELYSKVAELYHSKEGETIKRSTIRRCVNSLTDKAK